MHEPTAGIARNHVVTASEVTAEGVLAGPVLVRNELGSVTALGLGLPAPGLTVQRVAEAMGYDRKVWSGVLVPSADIQVPE